MILLNYILIMLNHGIISSIYYNQLEVQMTLDTTKKEYMMLILLVSFKAKINSLMREITTTIDLSTFTVEEKVNISTFILSILSLDDRKI